MLRLEDDSMLIHYELRDNSVHVMNAKVEAETSLQYVKAMNYISKICGIRNNLQTGSLGEGSVVKIFQFDVNMGRCAKFLRYVLAVVFRIVFFERRNVLIEDLYVPLANSEKDEFKKVLNDNKIDEKLLMQINSHLHIKKARSEYFKSLASSKGIKAIGVKHNNFEDLSSMDFRIESSKFQDYIEVFSPETKFNEYAQIFIASPVIIKDKKTKWSGVYNGEYINFEMKSNQFKTEAQNAEIDFRTGFFIRCKLQYNETFGEDENSIHNNYKVLDVYGYGYGCDENYVETRIGKKKIIKDNQPSLFDGLRIFDED